MRAGVAAGLLAWPASEVPSALHAAATGAPWWRTDRAAGALVLPETAPDAALLAVGVALRALDAATWGAVLARWLDRRHPVSHGAAVGVALAAVRYGLIGRRRPAVRALPALPQVADAVVLAVVVGRRLASSPPPP